MTDHSKLMTILDDARVFCQFPFKDEAMMIVDYNHDTQTFSCVGEESGEEYSVNYNEVDLDKDVFYKYALIDPSEY